MASDAAAPQRATVGTKLLFLDVDGVLHQLRIAFKDGKAMDEHCFVPGCMRELKRVVEATGAEIVLSSSWRAFEGSRQKVLDAMEPYGLSFARWTTTQELPSGRSGQVLAFVLQHEQRYGPLVSWAAVDDEPLVDPALLDESMMLQVFAARFVRTDEKIGIQAADADRLIAILNNLEDEDDG